MAGIKGGLFSVPLSNVPNPVVGGSAGKVISTFVNFYSDIPLGQKLTNAAVSPDGMFAIATSNKRQSFVCACLNALGDPSLRSIPTLYLIEEFQIPAAHDQLLCRQVELPLKRRRA